MIGAAMAAAAKATAAKKEEEEKAKMGYTQWVLSGDGSYSPVGSTSPKIAPGFYDVAVSMQGQVIFSPVRTRGENLLKFPDSASKEVLDGIADFWERERLFAKYGLPFKRGILLYGPPGSGKSCTLQLVSRDVIERGGIVMNFKTPQVFLQAYRALRDIQPDTPVVVLIEDFDALPNKTDESALLNLLDGAEELTKVCFVATTNYPERLAPRLINRPSRFDLRVKVDHPSPRARALYLQTLLDGSEGVDVDRYVADTEGMSLAHVKELFIATVILGNAYEDVVSRLRKMEGSVSSADGTSSAGGNYL